MRKFLHIVVLVVMVAAVTGCRKDAVYADESSVRLEFSEEKVTFDTVFAAMGTTTRMVKVYNRSQHDIELASVTLVHGRASRFRLNVDGDTSMVARRVELQAGDSMHIYVQAHIRPNDDNSPFVVTDSILFSNGQVLPLEAYGRNAVYHKLKPGAATWYDTIACSAFRHDRPHVFLSPAAVLADSVLTLLPGDELYFANGAMLVIDSAARLNAVGTADQPILFTSLRHDPWYRSLPGQWQTVWFYNFSTGNVMDHCVVENAMDGIRCFPGAELTISNTVIRNMSDAAIVGQGVSIVGDNVTSAAAKVVGDNLLVYDCLSSLVLIAGGDYAFNRCTLAHYWNYTTRDTTGVIIANYYPMQGGYVAGDLVRADFTSCIIYGTRANEVSLNDLDGFAFNASFTNCLVRGSNEDVDPMFVNPSEDDYHLQDGSPAAGIGYNFDN